MFDFITNDCNLLFSNAMLQKWNVRKYSYKNICRPNYGFLYLVKGRMTFTFENKQITIHSGDIIFLPKDSNYEVEFDLKELPIEDFLINFDILDDVCVSEKKYPIFMFNDRTKVLLRYVKDVVDCHIANNSPYLLKSLFYLFIHTIFVFYIKNFDSLFSDMNSASVLLSEEAELSVDDISKTFHMSRSSFQKKFKEIYGVSPIEYRMDKRIERAKILLQTTSIPIKEISDMLNFYDVPYFYRIFKKNCGITPKQFRDELRPII